MGVDRDSDTLLNGVETGTGIFVNADDTGTSAAMADTDGDGYDDGVEVSLGTDPNNALDFPGSLVPSVPSVSHLGMAVLVGALLFIGGLELRRRQRL
jgi:hypothetical protein